jgi:hypothetical protein
MSKSKINLIKTNNISENMKINYYKIFIEKNENIIVNDIQSKLEDNTNQINSDFDYIFLKYKSSFILQIYILLILVIDKNTKKLLNSFIFICNINSENNFIKLFSDKINIKLPLIRIDNPLIKFLTNFCFKIFEKKFIYVYWTISNYLVIYKIKTSNLKYEKIFQKEFNPGIYLFLTESTLETINEEFRLFILTKPGNKLYELSRTIIKKQEIYNLNEKNFEKLIKTNMINNNDYILDNNLSDFLVKKFILSKLTFFIETQKNIMFLINFKKLKLKKLILNSNLSQINYNDKNNDNIDISKFKEIEKNENFRTNFFQVLFSKNINSSFLIIDKIINDKILSIKNYKIFEKNNTVDCEYIQNFKFNIINENGNIGKYEIIYLNNHNFLLNFIEIGAILLFNLQERDNNYLFIQNIFEIIIEDKTIFKQNKECFLFNLFDFELICGKNHNIEWLILSYMDKSLFKRYEINLNNNNKVRRIYMNTNIEEKFKNDLDYNFKNDISKYEYLIKEDTKFKQEEEFIGKKD